MRITQAFVASSRLLRIQGRLGGTQIYQLIGASSYHSGGVNVGMMDGSVRFIKDTIDYPTWLAISTTKGSEIVNASSL